MTKFLIKLSVALAIFVSCTAALLDTPKDVDISADNGVMFTQRSDPCDCSCGPLNEATDNCANSTDTFCGCDAWIKDGVKCVACQASQNTTTFTAPVFQEITLALCLCQKDCPTVADAAFKCGLGGDCLCSTLETEGEKCNNCIKSKDNFAGLLFETFISSCKNDDEVSGDGSLH